MKDKKLDPVFAIYAVGITWCLYGLLLPLYRLVDLIICAILSAAVCFIMKKFICKPEYKADNLKIHKTGVAEADEIIKQGKAFINTLERQNIAIPDTKMSRQIDLLRDSTVSIFEFVGKNPESARQLTTFIEYYLPTVIKLLDSYIETQNKPQSVTDGNIAGTISKIEGIMDSVTLAFQRQLDTLYEHKNIDVKTDIEVLKNILSRENLI